MLSSIGRGLYETPALLLILTTAFWGGNAIAGQLADGSVSPMALVFLRWVLVAIALWALFGRAALAHADAIQTHWRSIATTAFIGFTCFNALFYIASLYTSAVNVGILQGVMPAIVMGLDYALHRERMTLLQLIGVPIALIGVVVVATQGDPLQLMEQGLNFGDGLMLVAGVCYAVYTIRIRHRPAMPGLVFFTWMAPVAAITSLPMIALEAAAGAMIWPNLNGWLITLFVAVFPSCLSQLFFLRAVDLIGPGKASMYINLVPLFAALFAVVLLGESFALYHGVALALVVVGIVMAQTKLGGAPKAAPPR